MKMKLKQLFCGHKSKKVLDKKIVEENILIVRYICPKCGKIYEKEYDIKF